MEVDVAHEMETALQSATHAKSQFRRNTQLKRALMYTIWLA